VTVNPHANANDFMFLFMADAPFDQFADLRFATFGRNDHQHGVIVRGP
jgi:hypothetical protein